MEAGRGLEWSGHQAKNTDKWQGVVSVVMDHLVAEKARNILTN